MSIKNTLKHFLFKLPDPIIDGIYSVYNHVFYPELREKLMCYGENHPDKTFYVIRPRTDCVEGLMSLFFNVVKHLEYASSKGWIPVVDFENYKTQYTDLTQDIKNAWEYYFEQTSAYSLEDVYKSRNVRLSGLNATLKRSPALQQKYDEKSMDAVRRLLKEYIRFNSAVNNLVDEELKRLKPDESIGLYLRGTDYVKLRPSGHPVQPSVEQAVAVVDKMMERHLVKTIFLVTEDGEIYDAVQKYYGDKLCIVSYDSFITGYQKQGFISHNPEQMKQLAATPYQRGLNYLCKLIVLSKCRYFVGGNTSGAWAACAFSDGFEEQYVFDLGKY